MQFYVNCSSKEVLGAAEKEKKTKYSTACGEKKLNLHSCVVWLMV